MIELYNWKETTKPHILHFQGKAKLHYSVLFKNASKIPITNPDNLCILTCATEEEFSPLINQLKASNIKYTNLCKLTFYHCWDNTQKLEAVTEYFKTADLSKIYLFLDAYDTAIQSLDGLLDKFLATHKEIIFNSTKHNWPNIFIDRLHERDFIGDFRYFNAGICIGYGHALKKFYNECLEELYKTTFNPWKSEQLIVRKVWARYSEDPNRKIDFDYNCELFQTFGSTKLEKIDENKYKVI